MTHKEWLMKQCDRYEVDGRYKGKPQCHLSACIKRSGWNGEVPIDYNKATCHAHEILLELIQYENLELRKEHWPLCPKCGENELVSIILSQWVNRGPLNTEKPTIEACLNGPFYCLLCGYRNEGFPNTPMKNL